jgi:hypothetical protein
MLDPNWTPQAGYSHADALLAIINSQEREVDDDGDDNPEGDRR